MGIAGNSTSVVDRKENKQRNLAESETKHPVRSHNKNAENAIFRTRDEGTSFLEKDIMLGITAGRRKNGKSRMRWMVNLQERDL